MIVRRWKPKGCDNYGDALVEYLAPKLFHANVTTAPGTLYFIGTLLGSGVRDASRPRVVFGTGTGYSASELPEKIYFVRGPHTAAALGGCSFITDPGILVQKFFGVAQTPKCPCSYMPRWDAVGQELFEGCDKAGIRIIDPRWSVPQVTEAIRDTKLLLTETLHGAVVADALRVPWVSIYGSRGHEFKWRDWTASMEMVWNPIDAVNFTLSWARDYAVPQLSARSVLARKTDEMLAVLDTFNHDLETL